MTATSRLAEVLVALDDATRAYLAAVLHDASFDADEQRDAVQGILEALDLEADQVGRFTDELLVNKDALAAQVGPEPSPAPEPVTEITPSQIQTGASRKPSMQQQRRGRVLLLDDPEPRRSQFTSPAPFEQTRVCQYYLSGECLLANCPYLHDTQAVVCRFWMAGNCLKGEDCPFVHALPADEDVFDHNDTASHDDTASHELSEFECTQLDGYDDYETGLGDGHSIATTTTGVPSTSSFATAVRVGQLQERFPHVDRMILRDTLLACDGSVETASEQLVARFGKQPASTVRTTLSSSSPATSSQNHATTSSPSVRAADAPHPSLWVDTGATVSKLYADLRAEAIEHAKARNKFFQQSTLAYQRGDGATAKKLSQLGRWHQQRMNELHSQASQSLFEIRNKPLQSANAPTFDLHGLHIAEAERFLDEAMDSLRQRHYTGAVNLIVGTGHHAKDARGRLGASVVQYLKNLRLEPNDISTDGRGGMLRVIVQF